MYDEILLIIAGLAGLGGLISAIVNILKWAGIVKDGQGGAWVQALNLLAFIVIAVLYFVKVQVDWGEVDSWLKLAASILGYILQVFGSKLFYSQAKGAPVIGYSHSLDK